MPKIVASKADWIKLGYELFAESGISGLVIDKMSKQLQCNKSSFYWHFKTKTAFIDCLAEYWVSRNTESIVNKVMAEQSPKDQFLKLIELALKKDSNWDFIFHLKKYAQSHKNLRTLIDNIDNERTKGISQLLKEMGYTKDEATIKAQVSYKYFIGYHEMQRYKTQPRNYLDKVMLEVKQFIQI